MPQLELQHTNPTGHTVLPHCSRVGAQSSLVQPSPGSTQMPQLGLQHSSLALQNAEPHCRAEGGSTGMYGHICAVQAIPDLVQALQEGWQQVKPASHNVLPHLTPSIGTQWAPPLNTLQVVVSVHLAVAQGVIVLLGKGRSIGLLCAAVESSAASSRALTGKETSGIMMSRAPWQCGIHGRDF